MIIQTMSFELCHYCFNSAHIKKSPYLIKIRTAVLSGIIQHIKHITQLIFRFYNFSNNYINIKTKTLSYNALHNQIYFINFKVLCRNSACKGPEFTI